MKKTVLAVAVLLGAAVCVSSCTDEDYEEQLYDGTAVAGTVGAAQPVSHDLRTHVVATKGSVGAAQPVSHDLRTHVVAGTVGAAQPVSHDLRTHVIAGTVGAAQPVSHDLRTHVVAARGRQELDHIGVFNAYMKICGPDINGGSSSKGYADVTKPTFHRTLVAAAVKDLND